MSDRQNKSKTSLYLPLELEKQIKIHCATVGIKKLNDFFVEAIKEKLERCGKNE